MLSRVAESIYWMSRYIERAENVARFIWVNLNLSLDMPAGAAEQWEPLVITSGDHEGFISRYGQATRQSVIRFLTFDPQNPNSIISCLTAARENARAIRQVISSEMWGHINHFYLSVRDAATTQEAVVNTAEFYDHVRAAGQQFMGVTDATMTHGEGWHFGRIGRMIERADKTSRILDVKYFILLPNLQDVGTPIDHVQWAALLRSASALEMYRQRHGRIVPERVVEFLVFDREFPRAILMCLTQANESLHAVTGTLSGGFSNLAEQRLGQLRADLAYTHAHDIVEDGLHEFIDDFQARLNRVGEAIYETFFAMRSMEPARGL